MQTDLSQVVAEKMQSFPIEKQQKVLEFVEAIEKTEEPKRQSLLDKLEAISKRVPDEVWERLPSAENSHARRSFQTGRLDDFVVD